MYCCPNCFSDTFLKNQIINFSNTEGNCDFCKKSNVSIIETNELSDQFELLLGLYEQLASGDPLNELIQNDWGLFNFSDKDKQRELLASISDNENIITGQYKPVHAKEKKDVENWKLFREELKHNNRFFPRNAFNLKTIEPFGKHIGTLYRKDERELYRARICNSKKPFGISEMGKPPKEKVLNGRANPLGIPYLYLANSVQTAISEVRCNKGEYITVATFEINENLELADLRDPKTTISPFELESDAELEMMYRNMPFLILLGNELSKPVIPRIANLEYLASQYLCELIKHSGFHGIIYKSSLSEGDNLVIFNDDKLIPTKTVQYYINNVNTEYIEVK